MPDSGVCEETPNQQTNLYSTRPSALEQNPFYRNSRTLELLVSGVLTKRDAEVLFQDPWLKAEEVEQTGLRAIHYWTQDFCGQRGTEIGGKVAVLTARVRYWQLEWSRCTLPEAQKWHAVYPPLSE